MYCVFQRVAEPLLRQPLPENQELYRSASAALLAF